MQETTFTELRNHAKDYFDAVATAPVDARPVIEF